MKSAIYKRLFWILVSGILSLLVVALLAYTGIALKLINVILKIEGADHWEGETRSPYVFNAMLGIVTVIFVIVLFVLNFVLFKKRINRTHQ